MDYLFQNHATDLFHLRRGWKRICRRHLTLNPTCGCKQPASAVLPRVDLLFYLSRTENLRSCCAACLERLRRFQYDVENRIHQGMGDAPVDCSVHCEGCGGEMVPRSDPKTGDAFACLKCGVALSWRTSIDQVARRCHEPASLNLPRQSEPPKRLHLDDTEDRPVHGYGRLTL